MEIQELVQDQGKVNDSLQVRIEHEESDELRSIGGDLCEAS